MRRFLNLTLKVRLVWLSSEPALVRNSLLFHCAGRFPGCHWLRGIHESGCALISLLARELKKKVNVGRCDFRTLTASGLQIPEGAVIFTSYAAQYVPEMSKEFVGFLCGFQAQGRGSF